MFHDQTDVAWKCDRIDLALINCIMRGLYSFMTIEWPALLITHQIDHSKLVLKMIKIRPLFDAGQGRDLNFVLRFSHHQQVNDY